MLKKIVSTFVLSLFTFLSASQLAAETRLPIIEGIGGDFSAKSTLGHEIQLSVYQGKAVILFFGFTNCADICPVSFSYVKNLVNSLGKEADRLQVIFVTVDPENDTSEHLKKYIKHFDPNFIGVSDSQEKIDHIVSLFKGKYDKKVDEKVTIGHHRMKTYASESFQFSHSQQFYLLDTKGKTRGLFYSGTPLEELKQDVLALIAEEKA